MPRGTGERTVTATSARHAPSSGRPAAAHTRGPASPWPGVDAPTQRPPYKDRTSWRHDSRVMVPARRTVPRLAGFVGPEYYHQIHVRFRYTATTASLTG